MEEQMNMDHLHFEIESVNNYLLDQLLQRKKLPREVAQAFKYTLNIAMRINHIFPEFKDKKYTFTFSDTEIPYFVTITAQQCNISNKTLLYKAFQKTKMIITIEPNKVLLYKDNKETILFENSLANNAMNPAYDTKPYVTSLLIKYKIN